MEIATVAALLDRELATLQREIEAYPSDASLWVQPVGIPNPGGILAHHLTGNLRHFIGARLGGSGYVRDRAAEFSRRDLTRAELVHLVEEARGEVRMALGSLDRGALDAEYPEALRDHRFTTRDFLAHLLSHLAYHLGQIDYHRRMVTGSREGVNAVATQEIPGAWRER
jgi:hypothetical protein